MQNASHNLATKALAPLLAMQEHAIVVNADGDQVHGRVPEKEVIYPSRIHSGSDDAKSIYLGMKQYLTPRNSIEEQQHFLTCFPFYEYGFLQISEVS
jgi:hypothetical protein